MTLDFLSKHGVVIGVVSMLAGCLSTISTIYYICIMYFTDEGEKFGEPFTVASQMFLVFAISLVFCIASCLMVYGIVKKRHLYLTPWLATAFLASLYISGVTIYEAVRMPMFRFYTYLNITVVVGGSVILLYPLCHLALIIRRNNSISLQRDLNPNEDHNILRSCEIETEKSTQCV